MKQSIVFVCDKYYTYNIVRYIRGPKNGEEPQEKKKKKKK